MLCSLAFEVEVVNNFEEKVAKIVPLLQARTGPAIVYVTLQKHAEALAARLRVRGLDAMVYHAGLPNDEREKIQMQFMESDKGIVCATIAFGMGIDKANIRQVRRIRLLITPCDVKLCSGNTSVYAQDVGELQPGSWQGWS